jgi:hypothetical protein
MIYNVVVHDEYGHPTDVYRIGAWDDDHAEDWVATRLVRTFGANAPYMSYKVFPEGELFLVVPEDEIEDARDAFFEEMGLTRYAR